MVTFMGFKKTAFLAVALVLSTAVLGADEKTNRVDQIFAPWDKTNSPGAALVVINDGRVLYKRGYGMAKLEDGIVMTPDKIFDIGSVSKQFTATCVVLLVREGKISLDDNVRKYIPELPDYGTPITVRHLLHHTSGLRDYNALLELAGFDAESDCPTNDEALGVICRQKKLNYTPGEEYSYTNTGYFLLGKIVERVSGKSLNAFAQERIFQPLGMEHTLFQEHHQQIIKNRAAGYSPGGAGFRLSMSNWDETGDGNVYTSVEDLFLWDQAFYTNKLGKETMAMLHTTGVLTNGKKIEYAYGLVVTEYKGLKVVQHGGAWAGFRAAIVRFPEQKFSVICLANLATMNPSDLALKVADVYLADLLHEPAKKEEKKAEGIILARKDLESLAGNYQDTKFGRWITLTLKEDRLILSGQGRDLALMPVSQTAFLVPENPTGIRLEFAPVTAGKPLRARMTVGQDQEFFMEKAAPVPALTAAQLAEFTGVYVSDELLGIRYQIALEKDMLVLKMRTIPGAALKAMAPDKFTGRALGANIEFVRDGNKVMGFKLGVGRAGGIEFVKK